jgi:hypothetical protein
MPGPVRLSSEEESGGEGEKREELLSRSEEGEKEEEQGEMRQEEMDIRLMMTHLHKKIHINPEQDRTQYKFLQEEEIE